MGQEAEVADGCPDYPQLKDRGNEGEMEMWEDVLKEAISPSNFLVSALHPEEKKQISRSPDSPEAETSIPVLSLFAII